MVSISGEEEMLEISKISKKLRFNELGFTLQEKFI